MILTIKNKFLSPTGASKVLDVEGKPAFKVKGVFLSPIKTKKICDLEGNKLFVVKNRWFNWLHHETYIFNEDGEKIGALKKNKYSVTNSFDTEDFEDDIQVKGKLFSLLLTITKNGATAAEVRRNFSWFVDKFTLQTDDVKNLAFYVAIVIAIDNLKDKQRKERD